MLNLIKSFNQKSKFIRIHFGQNKYQIAGFEFDCYMFEKSRVIFQQHFDERNFHIFYYLLSCQNYTDILFLQSAQYNYLTNGLNQINEIDDSQQFKKIEQAFEILKFDQVCLLLCHIF